MYAIMEREEAARTREERKKHCNKCKMSLSKKAV